MSNKNIKEVIKTEYLKCAMDPAYFLKKDAVIQHPMEGKIPFSLYPFQEKMINDFTLLVTIASQIDKNFFFTNKGLIKNISGK